MFQLRKISPLTRGDAGHLGATPKSRRVPHKMLCSTLLLDLNALFLRFLELVAAREISRRSRTLLVTT